MKETTSEEHLRMGLIATDPLRIIGLQTIFSKSHAEVIPLSVPGALDESGVSLILIDAACTEHLFELLATFHRTRPRLRLIVIGMQDDHEYIQRVIGAGAKGYFNPHGEGERDSAGDRNCAGRFAMGSAKGTGAAAGVVVRRDCERCCG